MRACLRCNAHNSRNVPQVSCLALSGRSPAPSHAARHARVLAAVRWLGTTFTDRLPCLTRLYIKHYCDAALQRSDQQEEKNSLYADCLPALGFLLLGHTIVLAQHSRAEKCSNKFACALLPVFALVSSNSTSSVHRHSSLQASLARRWAWAGVWGGPRQRTVQALSHGLSRVLHGALALAQAVRLSRHVHAALPRHALQHLCHLLHAGLPAWLCANLHAVCGW